MSQQELQNANLKNMSLVELKNYLGQVQHCHDILEAKKEELANQIVDLKLAVKGVESQREEEVKHEVLKHKELAAKEDTLKKALAASLSNESHSQMLAYKQLTD